MEQLRRGGLIPTKKTEKWSVQEKSKAHATEQTMVFTNFNFSDQGKSRKLVATFNQSHPDYEKLIRQFTAMPKLIEGVKMLMDLKIGDIALLDAVMIKLKVALSEMEKGKQEILFFNPKTESECQTNN